ncbi:MAG: hypothetical protein V3U31_03630, partial [Dehalococcoidia bacterium]
MASPQIEMGNSGSRRTIVGALVLAFIVILLLLQVAIELIAWNVLLGLWLLTWPALITVVVGVIGLVMLLRRRRILVAGLWIALVVLGFVGVRFALNNVGGDILIPAGGPVADWPVYGRDTGGSRYSPLAQINRDNVSHLEIAWEYHTGDFSDGSDGRQKTSFQATPIMVAG